MTKKMKVVWKRFVKQNIRRVYCLFLLKEPLNSEDDVSDEDPVELFETDNVVVCQYDKVIILNYYFI